MSDDPRDRELEAAYGEAAREEPPPELDEKLLAAAHRAVRARPAAAKRGWVQRYRVPLSLAATAVLAVTVTVMVQDEERARRLDVPAAAPPAGNQAVPPAAPATATGESRAAPSAVERRTTEPVAPAEGDAARAKPATTAAPAPMPAPPPTPSARPTPAAEGVAAERKEAAPSLMQAPAPTAPREAAPAPLSRERPLADRPGRITREDEAAGAIAPVPDSPEAMLDAIRRLKADGDVAAAAAQLQAFAKRYPDYPLPADLK